MPGRGVEVRFNLIDQTKFDQFEPIFQEEMLDSMTVITNKVAQDAAERAPQFDDFFLSSIQPLVSSPTEQRPSMRGEVVATATHAGVIEGVDAEGNEVEFGRRPGTFPNLTALRNWVEKKLGPDIERRVMKATKAVRAVGQKVSKVQRIDFLEREIDQATFAIGRSIQLHGLKPESRYAKPGRPIGDAFRANEEFIFGEAQRGIDRTLNRL